MDKDGINMRVRVGVNGTQKIDGNGTEKQVTDKETQIPETNIQPKR